MRIIAGKHRGRVLTPFAGTDIRPTADRVKESLFSILSPRLAGARVLDLFCGSGALGLECISRGAGEVVFNDASRESLKVLEKNLNLLKERATVLNCDFKGCLNRVSGKFDLLFVDPPYAEDYLEQTLALAYERNLLAEGGLIVYESERAVDREYPFWEKADERRYGRTYLAFFRRRV